jgi:hypothetical protein
MTEFAGGADGNARNLDVDLDIHFDAIISYVVGKVSIQHIVLLGLHAVNDPIRAAANNVHDNSNFFIGFGLGLGGAR